MRRIYNETLGKEFVAVHPPSSPDKYMGYIDMEKGDVHLNKLNVREDGTVFVKGSVNGDYDRCKTASCTREHTYVLYESDLLKLPGTEIRY